MRLIFAGTPDTAVPSLAALLASPAHEVIAVLTRPHARAGRGRHESVPPVEQLAVEHDIPVLRPDRLRDPEFLDQLVELRPDCCPVVAYGALIPPAALAIPLHGWVNLHFSLLPAWRGAAPVQRAILAGDEITGASTFEIEAGLDTGPVYGVVTEPVRPSDTAGELLARLAVSGADLLAATVDGIADGSLTARAQPSDGVSVAAKITVADARIDWATPAVHVDRLIRACTPAPGAWTLFRGERLKLGPVRRVEAGRSGRSGRANGADGADVQPAQETPLAPGALRVAKHAVRVGTASGPVELGEVQAPGKRPVPAPDWARGTRPQPGESLGESLG